jgi:pSer/pThr/pTyr-binding forkhead associated (FHA) protein
MTGSEVYMEDLNSTNGTYVNGKAVKKQLLQNSDTVEIGKYKIKYINEVAGPTFEKTMIVKAGTVMPPPPARIDSPAASTQAPDLSSIKAAIKVLSGAAAGREVPLIKVVTTIGKPGVAVAAITKRPHGFVVAHVEGGNQPTLNGATISAEPVTLKSGDLLELAGTQMQFVQG